MKTLYITYQRGTKIIWAHSNRTIKASRRAARVNANAWTSGWGEPRLSDAQLITVPEDGSIHSYVENTLPYIDCQSSTFIRWPDIKWKRVGQTAKVT